MRIHNDIDDFVLKVKHQGSVVVFLLFCKRSVVFNYDFLERITLASINNECQVLNVNYAKRGDRACNYFCINKFKTNVFKKKSL
jgi:hypothetical protein